MLVIDKNKKYSYDSRKISPGETFLSLPNSKPHIKEALDRGAVDVVELTREEFAMQY